jgi:hypothetical protein
MKTVGSQCHSEVEVYLSEGRQMKLVVVAVCEQHVLVRFGLNALTDPSVVNP